MREDERPAVDAMMRALWPDFDGDPGPGQILVWERPGGAGLGGFVQLNVRAYGEGCDTHPVPWIEGWWVAPDLRRTGVGRALIAEVESWARLAGFAELGSDTWIDNAPSIAAHQALGFEPTERIQFFRKRLR